MVLLLGMPLCPYICVLIFIAFVRRRSVGSVTALLRATTRGLSTAVKRIKTHNRVHPRGAAGSRMLRFGMRGSDADDEGLSRSGHSFAAFLARRQDARNVRVAQRAAKKKKDKEKEQQAPGIPPPVVASRVVPQASNGSGSSSFAGSMGQISDRPTSSSSGPLFGEAIGDRKVGAVAEAIRSQDDSQTVHRRHQAPNSIDGPV